MPLTPIDIQQKTFGPELRGYNMDEVDDFLDEVVTTLKDYDQQIRDAQDRIRALESEVATRGEDESAISRALVTAQKQADALIDEARSEAERIRDQADDESAQLRAERDAERMALTQEIARMRATVADLKRRVAELATSAEADLDQMDRMAAEASESVSGSLAPASAEPEPAVNPWEVIEPAGDVAEMEEAAPVAASAAHGEDEAFDTIDDAGTAEPDEGFADDLDEEQDREEHGDEDVDEADGDEVDLDDYDDAEGGYGDSDLDRVGDHEAPRSTDGSEPSPSNSRRPWERGSV